MDLINNHDNYINYNIITSLIHININNEFQVSTIVNLEYVRKTYGT